MRARAIGFREGAHSAKLHSTYSAKDISIGPWAMGHRPQAMGDGRWGDGGHVFGR